MTYCGRLSPEQTDAHDPTLYFPCMHSKGGGCLRRIFRRTAFTGESLSHGDDIVSILAAPTVDAGTAAVKIGAQTRAGQPLWLATASFDRDFELAPTTFLPTHQIAPDIDTERAFVAAGLKGTGWAGDERRDAPGGPA